MFVCIHFDARVGDDFPRLRTEPGVGNKFFLEIWDLGFVLKIWDLGLGFGIYLQKSGIWDPRLPTLD